MQNTGGCRGVWRVRSAVEAAVLDALDVYAERLEAAARLAARTPRTRATPPAGLSPLAKARADAKTATEGLARLAASVAAGVLADDDVAAEAVRLKALRAGAEQVLAQGALVPVPPRPPAQVRALRDQWPDLPVATRRAIFLELFEHAVVRVDKTVEVVRRFPDAPRPAV